MLNNFVDIFDELSCHSKTFHQEMEGVEQKNSRWPSKIYLSMLNKLLKI